MTSWTPPARETPSSGPWPRSWLAATTWQVPPGLPARPPHNPSAGPAPDRLEQTEWENAMLKTLDPALTPDLLWALAAMGHGDTIAIVDANYPAHALHTRVITLASVNMRPLLHLLLVTLHAATSGCRVLPVGARSSASATRGPRCPSDRRQGQVDTLASCQGSLDAWRSAGPRDSTGSRTPTSSTPGSTPSDWSNTTTTARNGCWSSAPTDTAGSWNWSPCQRVRPPESSTPTCSARSSTTI